MNKEKKVLRKIILKSLDLLAIESREIWYIQNKLYWHLNDIGIENNMIENNPYILQYYKKKKISIY